MANNNNKGGNSPTTGTVTSNSTGSTLISSLLVVFVAVMVLQWVGKQPQDSHTILGYCFDYTHLSSFWNTTWNSTTTTTIISADAAMVEDQECQATDVTYSAFSVQPRTVENYDMPMSTITDKRRRKGSIIPIDKLSSSSSEDEREENPDLFQDLSDSEEYAKKPESMYTDDPPCEPQYDWQMDHRPSCNLFHESDMTTTMLVVEREREIKTATYSFSNSNSDSEEEDDDSIMLIDLFRFVASGGYRDVYLIRDHDYFANAKIKDNNYHHYFKRLALKTLRWNRDFTERHYDRHRRDAIVADRLTSMPSSVDIYGHCGQSAIYEFAQGGDLKHAIDKYIIHADYGSDSHDSSSNSDDEDNNNPPKIKPWTSGQKVQIAYQIATSLADVHNVDQEGKASIAHTDISTGQFISIDFIHDDNIQFKINDFNRARLLRRNTVNDTVCPFMVKSNKGKFRSPEEYLYHPETEKVDVYSMGNIFWMLLHGKYPFASMTRKATRKAVSKGQRPPFDTAIARSDDEDIQTLIEATRMCWKQKPAERASARDVQLYLQSRIQL